MAGPLDGIRVIEIAGIGPGPFCATMLADMGADVVRIERKETKSASGGHESVSTRIGRSIALDLKTDGARELVLGLLQKADALVEGFRPGVMERLGLGPDICLDRNPRLVYGRMTGWGQSGMLSKNAGHDINYIAISGALAAIGYENDGPIPPLNLVGDFGGGGMVLAFGIACALYEARRSGRGQVIDAAMSDGAAMLMSPIYAHRAAGRWIDRRQANLLDGGAHFYNTYECADGKWIAVGAIEPQFYRLLLEKLAVEPQDFEPQNDRRRWKEWRQQFAAMFRSKSRDEWCALMAGADVCFAPVLDMSEAPLHPHNIERATFAEFDGHHVPAPVPRFSRTQAELRTPVRYTVRDIFDDFGLHAELVEKAIAEGTN